ncbi:ABC transporter ATP-binding protein [Nocardioides houyundeii]|uniref:ABC transporter ATP-binding protein n=1 Tax=Nocardioides houyundeii TaxID=2045452 RepID=UPI0019642D8B|nr:ABC transporter ATP-binding protein [Nocardioides houyundeii]
MSQNPAPADVLVVDSLVRRFGELTAVDGVSFRIAPGETYGLLGPNGAGKTTTISMVAGLIAADSGTVTVAGRPMTPRAIEPKRHLGLVPQDLAIYPELSARENLLLFGRLQGLGGARLTSRVAEVLELIGLTDRAKDLSKEYSGGMKRRLNIGIGLLHQPTLLILDEPTVGVDPQSRNAILESVEALAVEGMAVLYTTHYMEEAERLCDRIGIIDSGALQAEGTRDELIRLTGGVDTIRIGGTGDVGAAAEKLRAIPGVERVEADRHSATLAVRDAAALVADVVGTAADMGVKLSDVEVSRPDLESVFLHLTGKALRD